MESIILQQICINVLVTKNIVFLCNNCLRGIDENVYPPRKQSLPSPQRTFDGQSPSTKPSNCSPIVSAVPSKIFNNTKSSPQLQDVIESFSRQLVDNTATISALKTSVDSMKDTTTQKQEPKPNSSTNYRSYANIVKKNTENLNMDTN